MEKRLTNVFFDSNYINYDKFVANGKIILTHITTLKVFILTQDEYIKGFKDKRVRI